MRGLLVALGTTVVVLGSAAPAVTTAVAPPSGSLAPQAVVPGTVLAPVPAPEPLPRPGEGCTLPVGSSLPSCPGPRQPPVGCVLPVGPGAPGTIEPECPPFDPSPESRLMPVLPPLSR